MQRIGLSATQRPLETIARFLGGIGAGPRGDDRRCRRAQATRPRGRRPGRRHGRARRAPAARGAARRPGHDAADMRTSIWPAIHPRILELIRSHRSTIVFTNSRRLSRAARAAAQRAGRRGAGPRPPRQHRPRAAGLDRGGAQGRPAPRAGRHVQPRARHRHGRGRPRHPGREPDERRPRPPARRAGRPPGRGARARA